MPQGLLDLPGLTESPAWPVRAQPATLHLPPPEPGRPHLFALCLPEAPEAWLGPLRKVCSPARAARAARYRRELDSLRCLAAEALLRHAAQAVFHLEARELATALGRRGKPYFVARPEVHFNLSHSGVWILCALHGAPVGVDVEAASPERAQTLGFMSPQEMVQFEQLVPEAKAAHVFRLWTLKESLLKAAGTGLGHDPRTVTLEASGILVEGAPEAPPGTHWVLDPLPTPPGAAAALCFAEPDPQGFG